MDVQRALRSDIAMAFDDCTPYPATEQQARESMERSMRWAARSHAHYYRDGAARGLFGIVQGGMYTGVCACASLERCCSAIGRASRSGGLAVGEPEDGAAAGAGGTSCRTCRRTARATSWGWAFRRTSSRRWLRGIDMFDCVMPTRHARNGHLFTSAGVINIRNAPPATIWADRPGVQLLHLPRTTRARTCATWTAATRSWAAAEHAAQPALLPAS